ncbi:hypothetical protein ACTXT7_002087 [Hymenolepis weldensis]
MHFNGGNWERISSEYISERPDCNKRDCVMQFLHNIGFKILFLYPKPGGDETCLMLQLVDTSVSNIQKKQKFSCPIRPQKVDLIYQCASFWNHLSPRWNYKETIY